MNPCQNEYADFRVIGTFGIPLLLYPGLKLNFARPLFIDELQKFQPDVRAHPPCSLER